VGDYFRGTQFHNFTIWRCLENGTNNWSNQIHHQDKRQIAVKRDNIANLPADIGNLTTGRPARVELLQPKNATHEVMRILAPIAGFTPDRANPTGRDFRSQVVHVSRTEYLGLLGASLTPSTPNGPMFQARVTLALPSAAPSGFDISPEVFCYNATGAEHAEQSLPEVVQRKFGEATILRREVLPVEYVG